MQYKPPKWADPKTYEINNVANLLDEGTGKKKSQNMSYNPVGGQSRPTQPLIKKMVAPLMTPNAPVIPQTNMFSTINNATQPRPVVNKPVTVAQASYTPPSPTTQPNNNALNQFAVTQTGQTVQDTDPRVQQIMQQTGVNEDVALGMIAEGRLPAGISPNAPTAPTSPIAPQSNANDINWGALDAATIASLAAAGITQPNQRPVLDANGNPVGGSAIDQYYAGLNTKAPTYEELREQERKAMQAQIDVINDYYAEEMAKMKEVNKGRLNETSSIAVGAGLAGSPFQGAQEQKTKDFNSAEERALRNKQSAEIAAAMGLADGRAIQRYQLEMQQHNMDRTEYIARLKDLQTEARTSFVNLAKTGKKLSELTKEQLDKLMMDTGMDRLQLESMYNANLPAKDKVKYDYKELKDGTLMRVGDDGTIESMGNYSPPSTDSGWEVKEMGGQMYWINNNTKQFELIGSSGVGSGKAPEVKNINGVDSTWDPTTNSWKPVTVAQGDTSGAIETAKSKLAKINELMVDDGLNAAVGPNPLARWNITDLGGAKENFIAGVEQLVSNETMTSLLNLKKAGGTLGALSDGERQMLQNAATRIGFWAKKNKEGKVTGYDTDQSSFKKELGVIKDLTQKALEQAGGGSTVQNDPLGLGYTQFNGVVSQENPLGFNKELGNSLNSSKPKVLADSWVDPNTKDDVECVIYARTFAPNLPKMPYSDTDKNYNAQVKRSKINSTQPVKGAVAIMPNVGFYGHVAGIKSVNPDGTLTIREANYVDGKITERVGTPQELGIEGYWVNNQSNLA